jgi:HEAT repeat protein
MLRAALLKPHLISTEALLRDILGGVKDERSTALVLHFLRDDNWMVRARAAELLGLLGHPLAIEPLRTAVTDDPDADVRRAAVNAVAQLSPGEALPLLLAIQDNDAWVRGEAVARLGQIGGASLLPYLRPLLDDADEDVRAVTRQVIATLEEAHDPMSPVGKWPGEGQH